MAMQPAAVNTQQTQLFALSTLVQLVKRARHAETAQELAFIAVNETHALVPYRQAALWQFDETGSGHVAALSATPVVERNAPFTLWLNKVFGKLGKTPDDAPAGANDTNALAPRPVTAGDLEGQIAEEWSEWLPAHGLLVPVATGADRRLGLLLLAREEPWADGDMLLLRELVDGYAFAWAAWFRRRHRVLLANIRRRHVQWKAGAAVAALILAFLPVPLTALAPAEVVAFRPAIVRAPLDGVVDHFVVQPNEAVKEGQLLLELDPRAIENRLEIAQQALAVAEAEYRQAAQQALFDDKSRAQLAVLKGRVDQRQAEAIYNQSLLDRVHVTATQSGIAVFDDANDWIGKPVTIGERILEIADPAQVELEVWLPVADAVTLSNGARVDFFLNISPDAPVGAKLRQASYEVAMSPGGVLGYRLKAQLDGKTALPRIGLRGTAKVHGENVTLFYYLMRRPLAAARQFLGI